MDVFVQPPQIMGKSKKILKVFREIKKISRKDVTVLITGENGTYKELAARAIHYNSLRSKGPFIAVSLVSVPIEIVGLELFGYEKGAFSKAAEKRYSKIEEANRGTLFIDEISELDIDLQEKLCRFMREGAIDHTGTGESLNSDVRVIGSTSKNLKELTYKGQFREDLYKIFNTAHIKMPHLRERKEDILPIAKYLLKEAVKKFDTGEKELSKDAIDFLEKYDWPGNIRELENTLKKAAILSNGPVITKKDLLIEDISSYSIKDFLEEKLRRYIKEMTKLENCNLYNTVLSEVERSLIAIVLKETGFNQLKTARTLGINRNTLRSKIREYKIRI
ncbi:MAG: sigma-54-dependent Fis family transcriptional regulator [Nitrospirae bacterium]|jgi:DNA-binding NtrC family response regulator|nr:sigma-54-dependent Fis family transcriptional regulator [Nitrospirota bacterium]